MYWKERRIEAEIVVLALELFLQTGNEDDWETEDRGGEVLEGQAMVEVFHKMRIRVLHYPNGQICIT